MSNPGEDGWFPECLVCGMGNVHGAVCLDPTCHEQHQGTILDGQTDRSVKRDGHFWQLCRFCDGPILSDGGSFGVYALCIGCWNAYARAGRLPPSGPAALHDDLICGVLRLVPVQHGLVRGWNVIVRKDAQEDRK